ncbi:DUF72 domain-containing protein [soil metagenome]
MIRVGIGGWNFEEWRGGAFYPAGLPATRELAYASERLTCIEVNGTFYRNQTPATFSKWAAETPETFMFSLKAPRYATQRKVLADSADSIKRFVDSQPDNLGAKLGPVVWQLNPYHKFDAEDLAKFFDLLPRQFGRIKARHALEVRHASFACEAFVDLARKHDVAICIAESDEYPAIADVTSDFVYLRLMRALADEPAGYPEPALDAWRERLKRYESGNVPADAPPLLAAPAPVRPRDVFAFCISGAKVRNPAAAQALIGRLGS